MQLGSLGPAETRVPGVPKEGVAEGELVADDRRRSGLADDSASAECRRGLNGLVDAQGGQDVDREAAAADRSPPGRQSGWPREVVELCRIDGLDRWGQGHVVRIDRQSEAARARLRQDPGSDPCP